MSRVRCSWCECEIDECEIIDDGENEKCPNCGEINMFADINYKR